ncbi:hypothetical protein CFC21_107281 [Triticum aestivum]|uniref:Plant heme peroxidase family profile domain-containing protein n=2 Tax=Triticum aestivum TaxID=4565 RepID=A0A9R1MFU1_WHEAT|nr:hypothetical protein CFC21_107281 [Triticum aestivum]
MAAAGAEKLHVLVACALLLLLAVGCQASPLQIGFYRDRCPQAEAVVKGVMMDAISQNPGNGAAMIRMLFHDCFVEAVTLRSSWTRPRSARRRRSSARPTIPPCVASS